MGRRGGGFGGRRSGGFRSHSHHGGGGGGQLHFPREVDENWPNRFQSSLCDCRFGAIAAESFCCPYCMLGRIGNVLMNAEYKEDDGCCQQLCWMACLFDMCVYGMGTPIYGGQARCGVLNRYQIGSEGCCSSCLIACCLPCCNVNQLAHELTSKGNYPGGFCGSRPSGIPDRPPPPQPQVMDLNALAMTMGAMQAQQNNGQTMIVAGGMNGGQPQQFNQQQMMFNSQQPQQFNQQPQFYQQQQGGYYQQQQQQQQPSSPPGPHNNWGDNSNIAMGVPPTGYAMNQNDNSPPPPPGFIGFGSMPPPPPPPPQ